MAIRGDIVSQESDVSDLFRCDVYLVEFGYCLFIYVLVEEQRKWVEDKGS